LDLHDGENIIGQANAPAAVIRNLLDVLKQTLSPRYIINWNRILSRQLAATQYIMYPKQFAFFLRLVHDHTFCVLTRCSTATRISAIGGEAFSSGRMTNTDLIDKSGIQILSQIFITAGARSMESNVV
jgi:hypothetical protein